MRNAERNYSKNLESNIRKNFQLRTKNIPGEIKKKISKGVPEALPIIIWRKNILWMKSRRNTRNNFKIMQRENAAMNTKTNHGRNLQDIILKKIQKSILTGTLDEIKGIPGRFL